MYQTMGAPPCGRTIAVALFQFFTGTSLLWVNILVVKIVRAKPFPCVIAELIGGFCKWGLDGLSRKILLKWIIWGYTHFRKPFKPLVVFPLLFFGNNKHFQDWVFAGVQNLLEFSEKKLLWLWSILKNGSIHKATNRSIYLLVPLKFSKNITIFQHPSWI